MNQRIRHAQGFIPIIIAIGIVIIAATTGFIAWRKQSSPDTGQKVCTQEAKLCPDGSYVGRTGPHCEFASCPPGPGPSPIPIPIPPPPPAPKPEPEPEPAPIPDGIEISLREGQREGSLLVQKIYPDRIEGLNYWEYPVATDQGHPITLRIGETASNGCTIMLTLIRIQGKIATFIKKTDYNKPCPICLAEHTRIDTPSGQIPVEKLQKGMEVWTSDTSGKRVLGTILETSKTSVPATHKIVHLILNDGRELFVSPGHPLADGQAVEKLSAGDIYDGARVISREPVPYRGNATYDILPSGETGFYWANGILMGSTLSR